MLLTGATGAVGDAIAKKLLKCGIRKLVLLVRDQELLSNKLIQLVNQPENQPNVHVVTLDLREP